VCPERVVEPLDAVEDIRLDLLPCAVDGTSAALGVQCREETLHGALSLHSPWRLMRQVVFWLFSSCWNSSPVYWADSTGRRNTFNQEVFMG